MSPRIGSLFTGYGGLDMAVRQTLGGQLAWYSENNPAASEVLAHHRPDVPNLGDITTINWDQVAPVDILTGGFPCQDVSSAGRRAGMSAGTRSGLWAHMATAIDRLRPQLVVIENVRGLTSARADCDLEQCPWCLGDDEDVHLRALGCVLGDLADIGYDAQWCGLRAADVGAPHGRYRIFVVAGRDEGRPEPTRFERGLDESEARRPAGRGGDAPAADADCAGLEGSESATGRVVSARGAPSHASSGRWGAGESHVRAGQPHAARSSLDWGQFEPAIRRWEAVLRRSAPEPTVPGRRAGRVLNPVFVEWLMGLPEGHVTGVPGLSRNDMLRLLGNGVVLQQAAAALRWLLLAIAEERAA